ncbi:sterol desaturase/sphingolipid hydroxylase (fatty acid hydroxylase superfamily) [Williamsia limnetica]|uniref:Sterol desaturase/sphingolipid hydroxylase (Fatty acid hydroxylase superfamily) n=1 Tax=Williamsia limnetica TaxID=882452 RepID=A0A318RVC5_WILLI|nr:sterol desaturase family protein [Williamsia limnetica]PYE20672.1 sterol desaturase/sphingolipid hydroxylase (fatty acid hydroxylase superfamily) [Williamsia limnetica]
MDGVVSLFGALPQPLRDPVALAIPFFLLLLVIESAAARVLERREGLNTDLERPRPGAYRSADARASISMGLVSIGTMAIWKGLALLGYAALFAYVAPWQLSADKWYTWVVAIVGVDVLFYAYHRTAHRVRLIWATHQAHHSSEYFNFSTALRQKWNNSGEILMWLPLPLLGVPPWMVFFAFSLSLVYQFWIHTERIGHLPRPFEFVFNTPSHHRVHHGRDEDYLDKNYGGILIIWDRMFGTFQKELQRPHYGLTKPVDTFNIWRLETREYAAIARDVRQASRWKDKLGFVLGPPGWRPREAAVLTQPPESLSGGLAEAGNGP